MPVTPEPGFTFEGERSGRTLRVRVSGELDMLAEPELIDWFTKVLLDLDATAGQAGAVSLDVTGVTFIDSAGLRALLRCQDLTVRQGMSMALVVNEGPVTRLLETAGVTRWFSSS